MSSTRLASKTYGYKRKRDVPSGTPKVCRRCDLWFAPEPRQQICDGCRRPSEKTKTALRTQTLCRVPGSPVDCQYPQVTGTKNDRFHPDNRIAAMALDHPQTWMNFYREVAVRLGYSYE